MATNSSFLLGEFHGQRSLESMGMQRVGTTERLTLSVFFLKAMLPVSSRARMGLIWKLTPEPTVKHTVKRKKESGRQRPSTTITGGAKNYEQTRPTWRCQSIKGRLMLSSDNCNKRITNGQQMAWAHVKGVIWLDKGLFVSRQDPVSEWGPTQIPLCPVHPTKVNEDKMGLQESPTGGSREPLSTLGK